mgnify:CR=1 FL=1
MTILWDLDPSGPERYAFALGANVRQAESPAALGRLLMDGVPEDLVVVGPDIELAGACDLAEMLRVDHPEMGVILLRRRVDLAVMGHALRSGVREVLSVDDLPALADACKRSRDLTYRLRGHAGGADRRGGRVVTVFSAKGGVGKTTFSTNLGAYLASQGLKTLIVDLDLAFGDVAISLQLLAERTMTDIVAMAGHLDEQGLASATTVHSSGLHALCAPAEPGEADRIPAGVVTEVLRVAKRNYDFVVVDTPPAFTEHVLAAFDISDTLVLIATLDIPALKNLRLTLDTLDLLGNPTDSRIVVLNRSDAKVGLTADDVVTAIKQDIAVMVPNSTDVPASVNRGVPIILDDPRHPVSVALRQLADQRIRGLDPEDAPTHRRLIPWGGRK